MQTTLAPLGFKAGLFILKGGELSSLSSPSVSQIDLLMFIFRSCGAKLHYKLAFFSFNLFQSLVTTCLPYSAFLLSCHSPVRFCSPDVLGLVGVRNGTPWMVLTKLQSSTFGPFKCNVLRLFF